MPRDRNEGDDIGGVIDRARAMCYCSRKFVRGGKYMPFIHIRAYSGRDMETKKKAAEAIMKTASEAMNAPEAAFTIIYEDIEPANWEKDVAQPIMAPLRDKMLIDKGKPV